MMRKLLLTSASLIALGALPAAAADLPRYKAPAPAPSYGPVASWTGCYLGGHVGGGWGNKIWTDQGDDISDNHSYGTSGWLGGVQVGCDYQFGVVVIGAEGSWSAADIKGHGVMPFEPEQSQVRTKIDSIATATGRFGLTADRALIYVKAGGAWATERHTLTEIDGGASFSQELKDTRAGWLLGTGIEYLITSNWSAKVEYNFMDFGGKNYLFDRLADDAMRSDQQLHTVKFGVNYRFGGYGKGPVYANY